MRKTKIIIQAFILTAMVQACGFESQVPWYEDRFRATDYQQVDRVGLPHMDEVLFGDPALEALRTGDVTTDEEKLAPLLADALSRLRERVTNIAGFADERNDAKSPTEIADQWTPYAIFIDINEPVSLESANGRAVEGEDSFDYVISAALGRFLEDQVAVIDRGLIKPFPYLPDPRGFSCEEDPELDEKTDADADADEEVECH